MLGGRALSLKSVTALAALCVVAGAPAHVGRKGAVDDDGLEVDHRQQGRDGLGHLSLLAGHLFLLASKLILIGTELL